MSLARHPNQRLRAFYKQLGPAFDTFSRRGTLLVQTPIDRVITGFSFEPHTADRRWLQFFACPLYVPNFGDDGHIYLTWGYRFSYYKKFSSWAVHVEGPQEELDKTIYLMENEGLPHIRSLMTLQGLYDFMLSPPMGVLFNKQHRLESLACTAALLRELEKAKRHIIEFRTLCMFYNIWPPPGQKFHLGEHPWETERRLRVTAFGELLNSGGLPAAIDQLDKWQAQSVQLLGIGDLMR